MEAFADGGFEAGGGEWAAGNVWTFGNDCGGGFGDYTTTNPLSGNFAAQLGSPFGWAGETDGICGTEDDLDANFYAFFDSPVLAQGDDTATLRGFVNVENLSAGYDITVTVMLLSSSYALLDSTLDTIATGGGGGAKALNGYDNFSLAMPVSSAPDVGYILVNFEVTGTLGTGGEPGDSILLDDLSLVFTNSAAPGEGDSDGDGLSDALEADIGTNPVYTDTDGDGIDDGTEYWLGLDPLVDEGATLPAGGVVGLGLLALLGAVGGAVRLRRRK